MASVNANLEVGLEVDINQQTESDKMSCEREMDCIVPFQGWCDNKGKKLAFNFDDFSIDEQNVISGYGIDEKGPFKVDGEQTFYADKKTKTNKPRAIFNKRYAAGKNACICKGFILDGVIKGEYNYGQNISFGAFQMETCDPDWFEIERRFNKKLDEKLKANKDSWLEERHKKKQEMMAKLEAEKNQWLLDNPGETYEAPVVDAQVEEPVVDAQIEDSVVDDQIEEVLVVEIEGREHIQNPVEFKGVQNFDEEIGGELAEYDNTLELKVDLNMNLNVQEKDEDFLGYIEPKNKKFFWICMLVFWLIAGVLTIGTYVLAIFVNLKKLEDTPAKLAVLIGTIVIFVVIGVAVFVTSRYLRIMEEIKHEQHRQIFEKDKNECVKKHTEPLRADQD